MPYRQNSHLILALSTDDAGASRTVEGADMLKRPVLPEISSEKIFENNQASFVSISHSVEIKISFEKGIINWNG